MGFCMRNRTFIDAIKALLPSGQAWNITTEKNLRKLFEAIAVLPDSIRTEIENVYLDYFPETTRSPEKWEEVFLVIFTQEELSQRRTILATLWAMNSGGQSLFFIQKMLQGIVSEIKVFENIPTSNPRRSNVVYVSICNYKKMICGGSHAVCGYRQGDEDFTPTILRNDTSSPYSIPNDERYWEFCFYVCKSVIRNSRNEILYVEKLQIDSVYKNYIEYLILRVKPVQTVAVLAIEWV